MRYGIFSDTHANIEALRAVLGAYEDERIDKYICIGDTVGYGASPNECCDLIRELAAFTILGNHDAAVAGRMNIGVRAAAVPVRYVDLDFFTAIDR